MSDGSMQQVGNSAEFRYRPLRVRAAQWDGVADPSRWGWAKGRSGSWAIAEDIDTKRFAVRNDVHDLWIALEVGDWVIVGPDVDFTVVGDKTFRATYEPVDGDD